MLTDDPNDMLWGRTSHPWANSSSGYVNGVSYTTTRYTEGTQLPKIVFASKKEEEEYNAFRDEVFKYDTEEYKEIQEELLLLESAIEVFCIRMGENITSKAGGGNFRYNIETDEFDLNISDYGDYDSKGKIAHECKHGFQYLNRELGFDLLTGEKIAYDRNDEHEAFERQRMFGKTLSKDKVNERYNYLLDLKSNQTIDNLPSFQGMKRMNKQYQEHNSVRFLYHGWQNDIR